MSCSGSTSPRGRIAIGVMQGQFAGDYPLVDPSEDIRALLADMYLEYDDPASYSAAAEEWQYPFNISRLAGAGCLEDVADITIVDAAGQVVFDTFTAAELTRSANDWSADYKIYEWRTADALCRIVVYKTWPAEDEAVADNDETTARSYSSSITPASAVIDARAVYKIPKRLRSLRVTTAGTTTEKFAGEIAFKNGYNTEITVDEVAVTNFRETRRITISGVAGSGLGKFYNCADDAAQFADITTINGVTPKDSGDFLIGAQDCLWGVHPTTKNGSGQLIKDTSAGIKFGGDCQACCSCEDYSDAAEYMNQVAYRYQLIGQRAQEVYTQHETNVALWTSTACQVGEKLDMFIKSQQCGAIDVAVTLCNTCAQCIPPSTLLLELYVPEPEDTYVPAVDAYQYMAGHKNLYGNKIVHEIDCTYTKLAASTVDQPIAISGNYIDTDNNKLIAADGTDITDNSAGDIVQYPLIKPRSLVWPTLVTNVFTADAPTTEPIYDPGTYSNQARCRNFKNEWDVEKNDPLWNWRASFGDKSSALNNYGIRIEDSAILPAVTNGLPSLKTYLSVKYLKPTLVSAGGFPTIEWGGVSEQIVVTPEPPASPFLTDPETHNRWWSSLSEHPSFGDAEVNGEDAFRVFEMINEGEVAVLFSTTAGVLTAMERVGVVPEEFTLAPEEMVVVGIAATGFDTDVVPSVGAHMVDFYGLFSDWQPLNSGVSNYYPAEILAVHTHTPENPLSSLDDFPTIYFFIKKPATHSGTAFPSISIDYEIYCIPFSDPSICYRRRSLAAQSFKSVRFYNMNFFTEHVLRGKLGSGTTTFVQPYAAGLTATTDSITSAAGTSSISAPAYSKPDRYMTAKTPRRISIQAPEVPPGSTIQIDFRVLLSEYSILDYITKRMAGDPFTDACTSDATTKACEKTDLTQHFMPIFDGSDRLNIIAGSWSNEPGDDNIFVIHAPAGGNGEVNHVNNFDSLCPPTQIFACDPRYVPRYWRLLRWKNIFEAEYPAASVPDESQLLDDYGCPPDVFNATVELEDIPDSEPAAVKVKVCGYVYVDADNPISIRKVRPKSPYQVEAVLTGRKPTGSLADLSQQHVIDNGCPGTQDSKKRIIQQNIRLKCDGFGRTPEC